jgi:hypothetical protein
MSPVPMMDEMSIPTLYLQALVMQCAQILKKKGKYVPDLVMAGGFIEETSIFKTIALSNFGNGPLVKAVLMGRSPITAAMKASYFKQLAAEGKLPKNLNNWCNLREFFIATQNSRPNLKRFKDIPPKLASL